MYRSFRPVEMTYELANTTLELERLALIVALINQTGEWAILLKLWRIILS